MGKGWGVGGGAAPRVQAEEKVFEKGRKKGKGREEMLQGRREVVRNGFLLAWEGYKKKAWGKFTPFQSCRLADLLPN